MSLVDELASCAVRWVRGRLVTMPPLVRRLLAPLFGGGGIGAQAVLALLRCIHGDTKTVPLRGKLFTLDLRDTGVSFHVLIMGWYEAAETDFFQRILAPGNCVVDVGANIGYFSTLFAELVGSMGKVLAIEPDPRSASILQTNLHLRGLESQVDIVQGALGAESGRAVLHAVTYGNRGDQRLYAVTNNDANREGTRSRMDVPVFALDDIMLSRDRLDVVKMDIQGFEGYALVGMRETRARFPDLIMLVEFWPWGLRQAGSDPREVLVELRRMAGTIYELASNGTVTTLDESHLECLSEHSKQYINLVIARPQRIAALYSR